MEIHCQTSQAESDGMIPFTRSRGNAQAALVWRPSSTVITAGPVRACVPTTPTIGVMDASPRDERRAATARMLRRSRWVLVPTGLALIIVALAMQAAGSSLVWVPWLLLGTEAMVWFAFALVVWPRRLDDRFPLPDEDHSA